MYSIYHFFAQLYRNRDALRTVSKLAEFPFDFGLLFCVNDGRFPDLAIRVNPAGNPSGGELIELKDSRTYSIPSFNSTIPTGKKPIMSIVGGKTNKTRQQMEANGDDISAVPMRDVYYMIRGRKAGNIKVCLVHGSFFETVRVEDLIQQAFGQVLEERLEDTQQDIDSPLQQLLFELFSAQESFSKARDVENASVKIRFRIMTEAKKEGNILNGNIYPEIKDNTLNLVMPLHAELGTAAIRKHLSLAFTPAEMLASRSSTLKHPFNGEFFVLSFVL